MTIQAPERHVLPEVRPAPQTVVLRPARPESRIRPLLSALVVIAALMALAVVSLALLPVGDELAPATELQWDHPEAMEISRTWVFDPAGEHGFVLDPGLHPTLVPIAAGMLHDVAALSPVAGP